MPSLEVAQDGLMIKLPYRTNEARNRMPPLTNVPTAGYSPPLPSPTFPRKFANVDWCSRKINPTKYVRSAGLELPSEPIGCSPRGSAMKRPLYYLLCAIACTSMVGSTMPMSAIAEAVQPRATAEQQAQAADTSSDTDKLKTAPTKFRQQIP